MLESLPGLAGRRMLVTGGSRGIGRATAVRLAAAGAHVGIAYRAAHEAAESALREMEEAAGKGGGRAWRLAADLSREDDVERLFRRVDEEMGGLDGFVGNAGVWNAEPRPLEELASGEWREMMEVNLTSIFLTTREAAVRMERDGRIVLLSSTAAQRGEPGHSHYAASKGAINAFCKSLARELGPRGITVNAVAPGWVDTEMSASALRAGSGGEVPREILAEIPLGRVAAADDVAGPICFLLSDLARHVHGEVLNVNGGSVLCG